MLSDTGRAKYVPVTDEEAVEAFEYLSRTEGIIPAVEVPTRWLMRKSWRPPWERDQIIVVNISGRGDKDVAAIARYRGYRSMSRIHEAFENKKAFIPFYHRRRSGS